MLDFKIRLDCAQHNAQAEIRYRAKGDEKGAVSAHNKVVDLIEAAEYPNVTLRALVRRLDRHKSLAIGIDRPVVDLALSEL